MTKYLSAVSKTNSKCKWVSVGSELGKKNSSKVHRFPGRGGPNSTFVRVRGPSPVLILFVPSRKYENFSDTWGVLIHSAACRFVCQCLIGLLMCVSHCCEQATSKILEIFSLSRVVINEDTMSSQSCVSSPMLCSYWKSRTATHCSVRLIRCLRGRGDNTPEVCELLSGEAWNEVWLSGERGTRDSVWAREAFHPYLIGRHFEMETDHRNLKWLMSYQKQRRCHTVGFEVTTWIFR